MSEIEAICQALGEYEERQARLLQAHRMFCRAMVMAIRGKDVLEAPVTPDAVAKVVLNRLIGGALSDEDPEVVAWIETFRSEDSLS